MSKRAEQNRKDKWDRTHKPDRAAIAKIEKEAKDIASRIDRGRKIIYEIYRYPETTPSDHKISIT